MHSYCLNNTIHGIYFYLLLLSFYLQITYRNEKLAKWCDKPVAKVSVKLLHHAKRASCIINIIIDAPPLPYAHNYYSRCQSCTLNK